MATPRDGRRYLTWLVLGAICLLGVALTFRSWPPEAGSAPSTTPAAPSASIPAADPTPRINAPPPDTRQRIALAAGSQIGVTRIYDPAYVALTYPGGDVPRERGVCCDVVIRALRSVGVDLQKTVHEDMTTHFNRYPNQWGLRRADANIDHRRVPNLMVWFSRHGWSVSANTPAPAYRSGDIIAWNLGNGRTHIGIVAVTAAGTPEIVHNIGSGTVMEPVLFRWEKIGHYRFPAAEN